jgi:hypothetical protein
MHWTVEGTDAIIALRCREATSYWGSQLQHAPHSDANRLTSGHPKMILTTYKLADPIRHGFPGNVLACD